LQFITLKQNNKNIKNLMIQNTISRLSALLEEISGKIRNLPASDFNTKPSPSKWSKKEILGHLCDSALNNIPRVVKAQFEPKPFTVIAYEQDNWVRLGDYQNQSTETMISLWTSLNAQFVKIVKLIPAEALTYACDLYTGETKTLKWLIDDYLAHMEYHLKQILPSFTVTTVYKPR
jgi:hypothetical protein